MSVLCSKVVALQEPAPIPPPIDRLPVSRVMLLFPLKGDEDGLPKDNESLHIEVAKQLFPNKEVVCIYTVLQPNDLPKDCDPSLAGLIVTGSPYSVNDGSEWLAKLKVFVAFCIRRVPIVGLCYGLQLLTILMGGVVEGVPLQFGIQSVVLSNSDFGEKRTVSVYSAHQEAVTRLPDGADVLAVDESEKRYPAIVRFPYDPPIIGMQKHFEFPVDAVDKQLGAYCYALGMWGERPYYCTIPKEGLGHKDVMDWLTGEIAKFKKVRGEIESGT